VGGQAQDGDGEVRKVAMTRWGAGSADLGAVFVPVHVTDVLWGTK
jgi:hypothetical protein